ncbi:MAG: response regulator [Actinomycetota bacterium]|nr:response regulator [Actinomycetota bacterium]
MAPTHQTPESRWRRVHGRHDDPEQTSALDAALDQVALAIAFDERGCIVRFNRACEELTGYSFEEVSGRPHWELLLAPDEARVAAQTYSDLEHESVPAIEENEWIGRDGTPHRLVWSQKVVNLPAQGQTFVVAAGVDVTDRRGLARHLVHSQRLEAVAKLSEGIAHDFNNLLSVINNYAEFLNETLGVADPRQADVHEIKRASERAGALIRQFLTFSRRDTGKPRLVDLSEVVLDMKHLLQSSVGEDVDMVTRLSRGMWRIRIDPGHVEQILAALTVQARKVLPLGGRLTIETLNVPVQEGADVGATGPVSGRRVCLLASVSMRERDGRAGSSAALSDGPHLATVTEIVERWGGSVVSEANVSGHSGVRLYFPIAEPSGAPVEPAAKGSKRGRGERVVVVEDEDAVRRLVERILAANHYEVVTADPHEALSLFAGPERSPELLLTDVIMPGLSGRELAERVQKVAPEARIVFMSGYTDDIIARHGVLEGSYDLLPKPFMAAELLETVRGALDHS